MRFDRSTRIAVLMGGLSKEREVSLRTGSAMEKALRAKGYQNVEAVDVDRNIAARLSELNPEVAVIALHGRFGEDGTIQGLLEYLEIPYTGTGVMGSAIAMDKVLSKKLFNAATIPTPPFFASDEKTSSADLNSEVEKLGLPLVCKPANEGSTIGLTVVREKSQIEAAQKLALQSDATVLWEKYVPGDELTVGILQGRPMPIVEIVPKKGLFDFEAKYTKGMTDYFCPARVSKPIATQVQDFALQAFEAVQAQSFGRVDLMWSDNQPWVIEVNTIPGMTETSLLPKAAKAEGMSFEDMVETILQDASLKISSAKKGK